MTDKEERERERDGQRQEDPKDKKWAEKNVR